MSLLEFYTVSVFLQLPDIAGKLFLLTALAPGFMFYLYTGFFAFNSSYNWR